MMYRLNVRPFAVLTALIACMAGIGLAGCQTTQAPNASPSAMTADLPMVILKLDDYGFSRRTHPGWVQTMDYLNEKGVVASIGLIGKGLERPSAASVAWLTTQAQLGHELWNHGYCHCRPEGVTLGNGLRAAEFRGTDYDYQLDQIRRTQDLAQEKLGITLTTFGAPYNSTDENTVAALATMPELTTLLYHRGPAPDGVSVLSRVGAVNIEYPVHQPDFAQFKQGFEQYESADVLVIQGHPRSWTQDPDRFAQFQQIISYLQDRGVVFTTPTGYTQTRAS